jgi:hypothetical protein
MKKFLRDNILYNILFYFIYVFVIRKFKKDKAYLPLNDSHKKLYLEIHTYYFMKLYSFPNLIEPKGINEKVQWLKLFDQSKSYVEVCDKLKVKHIIAEKIGAGYVPKTLNIIENEQDFVNAFKANNLPMVLKTNHDSGGVILIKDNDLGSGLLSYRKLLKRKDFAYANNNGEWAYRYIEPQIFIEEYVDFSLGKGTPDDFKFYCVNGEVKFCHYLSDRDRVPKEQVVDVYGDDIGVPIYPSFKYRKTFCKPNNWDQMLDIAKKLSEGFQFVRIDLYTNGQELYVGELTLWPQGGTYRGHGQLYYDKFLNLELSAIKESVTNELKEIHP